jgi:hypothetical protein
MKPLVTVCALFILYFIYGFYISQLRVEVIPPSLKGESARGWYDYRGVTNVRTSLSTGSSSPLDVISSAKRAGLDFLILTDSNITDYTTGVSGYHGNLLVLNQSEYNYLDSRLLFYKDNNKDLPKDPTDLNLYFTDLLSQKDSELREAQLVLAHPFKKNQPTWSGPYPTGLDGLEIINPKSIAANAWNNSKFNVLWSLLSYPFNPKLAFLRLFNEPSEELSLWDKLAMERTIAGFSGVDASAKAFPLTDYLIKFPSYQKSFDITSNHILIESELIGNFIKDKQRVLSALKRRQFYMSLDLLGDPKGFYAFVKERDVYHPIGSVINFRPGLSLIIKTPWEINDMYEIVVLKNGQREKTWNHPEVSYEITEPGTYRVIVRVAPFLSILDGKRWITWIYTNHFYVR